MYEITNFDYPSNCRKYTFKKLEATILFVDFSEAFNSIHKENIEHILLVHGLPRETIEVIMMLYKTLN